MRHLMGGFAWRAAREAGDYREHFSDEPDSMVFFQLGWHESKTRNNTWFIVPKNAVSGRNVLMNNLNVSDIRYLFLQLLQNTLPYSHRWYRTPAA